MNKLEIVTGDALVEMARLPTGTFDLVVADPPYNLGKEYGNNNDCWTHDQYLEFSKAWLRQARRLMKPWGTIYVFMGFRFISYLYDIMERQLGMHFHNWICWHYTQGMGRTKGFSPRHEDILMFAKGTTIKFNLDQVRVPQKYFRDRNNMRGANPGDVWQFSHVHYCNENRQKHPTQKPEGLIERMVLASSDEGDSVLDPFCGSGTTLRVCQQLRRNCVGIEMNPEYAEMAQERLKQEFVAFDSVDPRMERVPLDLRGDEARNDYLEKHKVWFLRNHQTSLERLKASVETLYGAASPSTANRQEELDLG